MLKTLVISNRKGGTGKTTVSVNLAAAWAASGKRVLFRIKSGANPTLKILGFLPIMVAENIKQHRVITGEIARQFGAPRVLAGIRTDIKLAEAFGAGQPIRLYAPRSRAAIDFAFLGQALTDIMDGQP